MADEAAPLLETAAAQEAAPATQVSTPPTETTQATTTPSTPTEGTSPEAQATSAAAASPAWWTRLGADEATAQAAVTRMEQQLAQFQQLAPYANAFAQHSAEFMEWQRSRQQQRQQPTGQPQQEKSWYSSFWNPPEYNPAWERQLRRDENNQIVAMPGTPPDVLPKYFAYAQYQNDFVEKFRANPAETLAPMIDARAEQIAQRVIQQQLGGRDSQQSNQQFLAEHNAWIYDRDQSGQPRMTSTFDPNRGVFVQQPVLSHWGRRFRDVVNEVHAEQTAQGYVDLGAQKRIALQQVRLEALEAQRTQQPTTPTSQAQAPPDTRSPREKANDAFVNGQSKNKPATNGNVTPTDTTVHEGNFASVLAQEFSAHGIRPEHFQR